MLLGEAPPALRAQQQIEGHRGERVIGQQKIRVFQVVGPADLGGQIKVRRQAAGRLFVGQLEHAVIDDGEHDHGSGWLLLLVVGADVDGDFLAGGIALVLRPHLEGELFQGRPIDEAFGQRLQFAVGQFLENGDPIDTTDAGRWPQRDGVIGPRAAIVEVVLMQQPAPAIRPDEQIALLAAVVQLDHNAIADNALRQVEHDAIDATTGQLIRPDDIQRRVDVQLIPPVSDGRKGEHAQPLIHAGGFVVVERLHPSDDFAEVIDDLAGQVGGLAKGRAHLEIDAVGRAGDQIAAFGEELD